MHISTMLQSSLSKNEDVNREKDRWNARNEGGCNGRKPARCYWQNKTLCVFSSRDGVVIRTP